MKATLVRFAILAFGSTAFVSAANVVTIRNRSGTLQTRYPLQIARPFAAGEIAGFPQIGICADSPCIAVEQWLPTQADVKTRWPDQLHSVKHAILSVILPSLPADSTPVYLTFRNQSACNCGASVRLSKAQMLDPAYALDARITADFGTGPVVRSAREMLQAWDGISGSEPAGPAWYWQEGPIATTIILADHSLARTWDFGSDDHRSLRPIFHLTFWPGIKAVRIRAIIESANSEAVQDQAYAVTIEVPGNSPYYHAPFTHTALTSWSRTFWIGSAPTDEIDIDHNLAYLLSTKAVPNFDIRRGSIPESSISGAYAAWLKTSKEPYATGPGSPYLGWQKGMSAPGGRPDIGPYPKWHVQWLYSGDYRLRQYALGLTELATAWPARVREGNPEKYLDRAHTVPGLGYPVSISTRPSTNFTTGFNYSYTAPQDRLRVVGPVTNGGWQFDDAHQPDPWSPSFLLTGDYYYLEQGQFWTAYAAHLPNGASIKNGQLGRGPTGSEGGLNYLQIRSQAWTLRSRVEIAELTPDSSPWKDLLKVWIADAIAQREGAWNITASPFFGDENWNWGHQYILPLDTLNGLHVPNGGFKKGDHSMVQATYGLDPNVSAAAFSLFEADYYAYAIGRAKELGYPAGNLVAYLGRLYTHIATPPFNPYLLQSGRYPTVKSDGSYYSSDEDLLTAWFATESEARTAIQGQGGSPVWRGVSSFPLNDPENGYEFLAAAALSFLTREPGGENAWQFASRQIVTANTVQNSNPKWALLPRSEETPVALGIVGATLLDADGARVQCLRAFGGVPPYRWSPAPGSFLPAGLTLFPDGSLAGALADSAVFTLVVSDGAFSTTSRSYSINRSLAGKSAASPSIAPTADCRGTEPFAGEQSRHQPLPRRK